MGRPAISRRTFLGKRVEASRAGMMAMVFNLEVRSIKDFGSSPQSAGTAQSEGPQPLFRPHGSGGCGKIVFWALRLLRASLRQSGIVHFKGLSGTAGSRALIQSKRGFFRSLSRAAFRELRSYLLLLQRPVVPLPVVLLLVVPAPAADGCAECLRSCSHSLQSVGPGQDH